MSKNNQKTNDTTQLEILNSQLSYLRDLENHEWWKFLKKEIDILISDLKWTLWASRLDETKKYNYRNLLAERLSALFLVKNIHEVTVDKLKSLINHEEYRHITLPDKLEKDNKKMAENILREIKL